MKVYNTDTEELITLRFMQNGQNMASEIFGQYNDPCIAYNDEIDKMQGNDTAIQWWLDYFDRLTAINKLFDNVLDNDVEIWQNRPEYYYILWELMPTDPDEQTVEAAKIAIEQLF